MLTYKQIQSEAIRLFYTDGDTFYRYFEITARRIKRLGALIKKYNYTCTSVNMIYRLLIMRLNAYRNFNADIYRRD